MKKIIGIVLMIIMFVAVSTQGAEASGRRNRGGNSVDIKNICKTEVVQTNVSNINNAIYAEANTGENDANRNHTKGGDVKIKTGNATVTTTVTNTTGGNFAWVSGCCCQTCGSCGNTHLPCVE